MTPTRLLLLSVLLLGAGYGLWQLGRHAPPIPPVELPSAGEGTLLRGAPADLRRLTLEQPRYGQRLRVEPDETGNWGMTEPIVDRIEPVVFQAVLGALWTRDWKDAPPEWQHQSDADLGLDQPAVVGALDYADGHVETLRVGAAGPGGRWYACRIDDRLVALGDTAMTQLQRPAQQWRDHRLQPFGIGVQSLRWEQEDGRVVEVEQQARGWYLLEPAQGRLSETAADFLARLLGARAAALGDTQAEPGALEQRQGVLTLRAGSGEEVVLQVWPGSALSSDRDFVVALMPEDLVFLGMEVDALLTLRLIDFDPGQVQSVRVEQGAESEVYRLQEPGWMSAGADSFDPEVASIVAALIGYAVALERSERLPVPEGPPAGRILYSISRTPAERGSAVLRWWVDAQGRILAGSGAGDFVTPCEVNLELGVSSLLERS